MSIKPKMESLWNEVFPTWADYCDSNIKEVLFDSKALDQPHMLNDTVGKLEIFVDVFPFDKNDIQGDTIHKKVTVHDAYVFGFPARDFVVGQMLKRISIYADIIRFDIVTTGSLLRFECDSYTIEDVM